MSTDDKPTLPQVKHTLELFDQQDIDNDDMVILHDGYLADFLEGVHTSRWSCLPTRDELRVIFGLLPVHPTMFVDYVVTLEEIIVTGQYDHVVNHVRSIERYEGINVMKKTKRVKIRLLQILASVNLQKNEAEGLAGKRYRLASWEEILTFGATFPKVQLRCKRGIYGKAYDGDGSNTFQPHLWSKDGKRGLSLQSDGTFCNPGTHFLYVER